MRTGAAAVRGGEIGTSLAPAGPRPPGPSLVGPGSAPGHSTNRTIGPTVEDHQDENGEAERDDERRRRRDDGDGSGDAPGAGGAEGRAEGAGASPEGGGPDGVEDAGGAESRADESERLSEEIREELEEMEELRERHLRLAAEFENYRKRTRQEMKEAREQGQARLVDRLLDALDDLERVLESPADATTAEALREGVEMVQRKLEKELAEAGLARMEPSGERFDPEYHEALLTTPTDDPDQNDVVSRVLINGYVFGDRVLRPARVEVKKYSASGAGGGGDADGEG